MLIKHTIIYGVSKVIPAISSMLLLAMITRYLTPEDYGIYSLCVLVATSLSGIFYNIISIYYSRFYFEYRKSSNDSVLLSTIALSYSVISVFILLITLLLLPIASNKTIVFSTSILLVSIAFYEFIQKIHNTTLLPKKYFYTLLVKSLLSITLIFIVISLSSEIEFLILSLSLSFFGATILNISLFQAVKIKFYSKALIKSAFAYGGPLTLTLMMIMVINIIGRVSLNTFSSPEELGLYSSAYDFTLLSMGTLLSVIHLANFPQIIKIYTNKKYQSIVALKNHFTVLFTISSAMLFGLFASYNEFASVFMGDNFGPKASFLIPYIATGVFFGLLKSFYFDYAFQLCKRTDMQLYSVIFSTVCSVFLHVGLVIYYGVLGAAVACVISFFIYLCTTFLLGRKLMKLPLLSIRDNFKLFVSVLLMFSIVNSLHFESDISTLIAKILSGVLIFTSSIIILNFSNLRTLLIRRSTNG